MNAVNSCPSPEALDSLVKGACDRIVANELLRHLEDCATCRRFLDERESLSVLADGPLSPAGVCEFGPAFYQAIDVLATMRGPRNRSADDSSWLSRFLDPPSDPRYLGRLGHYEILDVLGSGGMGIVFRAHDPVLNRAAAIKILAPHMADRRSARERFAREAQAAATINHDNVLSIYTVSESSALPYIVMPYVVGKSLADKLEREGRLPIVEVLRIGIQTALGLAAAHEQGVVHRDIKPSNLLLEGIDERIKIADFGLAFVVDGAPLTQSGAVGGTPEFMAPEQAREETVDPRCDLFSLGAVLYVAATGLSPFRAATPLATLRRVCDDVAQPITQFNPEATAWFAAVVERLLQKNPADRYQSASKVAESLQRQLATWSVLRRPAPRAKSLFPAVESTVVDALLIPAAHLAKPVLQRPLTTYASEFVVRFRTALDRIAESLAAACRRRGGLAAAGIVLTAIALLLWIRPWQVRTVERPQARKWAQSSSSRSFQNQPQLIANPALAIHRIEPPSGTAGDRIIIAGIGLSHTKRVLFFVRNGYKPAQFTAMSDRELRVTAPEWLTAGSKALIVVETPMGTAVSFPKDFHWETVLQSNEDSYSERPGYFVVRDRQRRGSAAGTVFVESGGALNAAGSASSLKVVGPYFVQGRGVADLEPRQSVVYAEPTAILSERTLRNTQIFPTPLISVANAGLFTYVASPSVEPQSAELKPVRITDIQPRTAAPNDIIVVRGSGLMTTTAVEFVDVRGRRRRPQPGFRVISDNELRVEVPDDRTRLNELNVGGKPIFSTCHLIVATKTGATVATQVADLEIVDGTTSKEIRNRIAWIKPQGVFSGKAGLVFIEPGGTLLESAHAVMMLVRAGGRSDARPLTQGVIFAEPEAQITLPRDNAYSGEVWVESKVPQVTLSVVDFDFFLADTFESPLTE